MAIQFQDIAGGAVGAEVGPLKTFATECQTAATEIQTILGKLEQKASQAQWKGKDMTDFLTQYAVPMETKAKEVKQILEQMKTVADANAQKQDETSQAL